MGYIADLDKLIGRTFFFVRSAYGENLVSFVLFGSLARGVPRPDSDIDLLIVADRLPAGRMMLLAGEAYSDVVREAQEIVELALKGLLRQAGIDPPKWHDVSTILEQQVHPCERSSLSVHADADKSSLKNLILPHTS